ncbi:hypothetical protein M1N92_00495 [Dehalococcoidia bacterium]|nr:hypothetical protein [Dehalococcoidia bacterium]
MTSILEYQRHKEQFQKELFRRIGYTNTLYQIFRFGDIIKETYHLFPVPQTVLVRRIQDSHPELKDLKYATGVVNVLGALNITKRVGPRVVLTHRGRALAALSQQQWYDDIRSHFFLKSVLEADGDYVLNLLCLMSGTQGDSESVRRLGITFFRNLLDLLDRRKEEVAGAIVTTLVRDVAIKQLEASKERIRYDILNERRPTKTLTLEERLCRLRAAKSGKRQRCEDEPTDTLRHTLDPRRGWLTDLGLVERGEDKKYRLTAAGVRLLNRVRADGFELDGLLRTPFSMSLAHALDIRGIVTIPDDYFQQLVVAVYKGTPPREYSAAAEEFLEDLHFFFELTRLKRFNQAEIQALYECVALKAATAGELLSERCFDSLLNQVLRDYTNRVYHVAGRYGREGYLSFRR